ncbi:hypothetical protein SAMN05421858_2462 [Haladaptatus litoreus]|uniref:DUF1440 domain-containing protein n=1 Tax=Haladaptatus litoreus TaxID=553468 RepID=A0A1N7BBW3_9EURY|nr:hypothetical protein [Haladaptatus litoreus]SIR48746.1 hypothetical protein SAMN05421858_2462 [Haladaptatus litoreus]
MERRESVQKGKSVVQSVSSRESVDAVTVARSFGRGLLGGLIATLVMTAYRIPIARSLPPTAAFWAQFVGEKEASEYPIHGLVLHLVYGMVGGGIFALLFERRVVESGHMDEKHGTVWGAVYGFLLSVFGIHVVLKRVLRMNPQSDERFIFHVSHLIYGVTLGAWLGSRAE